MEITDPKLVRAYAHPLRIQILGLLDNRTASPTEIATELGTPLSNTSYHVRQLAALGLVELVRRTARRGAIEHHYTAKVRPTITDSGWAQMPGILKRAVVGGLLQQTIKDVLSAAEAGGFDREDAHHSRSAGPLDAKGWDAISKELSRALNRIEAVIEESRERIAHDPDADAVEATVVLMQCEGPPRSVAAERARGPAANHADVVEELELDELSDLG
jgi:DNA-binding transcriptional ArsR family regulator